VVICSQALLVLSMHTRLYRIYRILTVVHDTQIYLGWDVAIVWDKKEIEDDVSATVCVSVLRRREEYTCSVRFHRKN
jgi:hypothetical protein